MFLKMQCFTYVEHKLYFALIIIFLVFAIALNDVWGHYTIFRAGLISQLTSRLNFWTLA